MKKIALSILSLLFFTAFLVAQSKVDLDQLDAYYAQVVKDWELPGMTVGIVKDGELIFSKGYGVKELGKSEQPDGNTLYAVASNSKAFTSAIIGMLVQEGKLNWDDPVQKYLPYFELYGDWESQHTTIRDLLCHRVGLGTFSGDVMWYKSTYTEEEIIKHIKYVPPAYEFRAGYGYSNLMYITAGEVIRKITGKSWAENVQERFLKPLGMDRSIARLGELEGKGNYATPHAEKEGKAYPIDWVSWDNVAATGGLISSVNDMAKWMIFNMDHGIWKGDTILSADTRNTVWQVHNPRRVDHTKPNDFNRHFNGYGLGWGLSDYHGRMLVGHTGGYDGFITIVNLIPDEKLGVVVLTNGVKSPIRAVANYTLDRFLGAKEKDWSKTMLKRINERRAKDTRITGRIKARKKGTKPTLPLKEYATTFHSDLIGPIRVSMKDDQLRIDFDNNPGYGATLEHWHFDVWKLNWDEPQAWFDFGTVQFKFDNNLEISGLQFDVPNYDIFFDELNPKRVNE